MSLTRPDNTAGMKGKTERPWTIIAIFLFFTLLASVPLVSRLNNWGIQDWDHHLAFAQVARFGILRYGQIPLWNPYHCGGISHIGNPQADLLYPLSVFTVFLGPAAGYKLLFALHLIIGLVGFYIYARSRGLRVLGSAVTGLTYMLSGLYTVPFAAGMTQFMSVAYIPYVLYFFEKSRKRTPVYFAGVSGAFLALMFFQGFQYFYIPIAGMFILSVVWAVAEHSRKPVVLWCVAVLSFVLLSAVKLIPSVQMLQKYPRVVGNEYVSGYSLKSLWYSLADPGQEFTAFMSVGRYARDAVAGISYGLDENGMYIGIGLVLVFLLGMSRYVRRHTDLVVLLVLFLWISFGYNINPSPYGLLRDIPVFQMTRVAQRYRFMFMVPVAVFAGLGADLVYRRFRRSASAIRPLLVIAGTLYFIHVTYVNTALFPRALGVPPLVDTESRNAFVQRCTYYEYDRTGVSGHHEYSAWGPEFPTVLNNQGITQGCVHVFPVDPAPICLEKDIYRGETYSERRNGTADISYWSPDRVVVRASFRADDFLIMNQNYDSGWKARVNGADMPVASRDGRTGVFLSGGSYTVEWQYLPDGVVVGAVLTGISLLVLAAYSVVSLARPHMR